MCLQYRSVSANVIKGRDLPATSQCQQALKREEGRLHCRSVSAKRVSREEMHRRCCSVSEIGNGGRDLPVISQCPSKR